MIFLKGAQFSDIVDYRLLSYMPSGIQICIPLFWGIFFSIWFHSHQAVPRLVVRLIFKQPPFSFSPKVLLYMCSTDGISLNFSIILKVENGSHELFSFLSREARKNMFDIIENLKHSRMFDLLGRAWQKGPLYRPG